MEIQLPLLPLRPYQTKIWNELYARDVKRAFILMHRRAGKDVFCLQYMISKAIQEPGNYYYLLPQQNQVRRAIWEGITSKGFKYLDMIPKQLVLKISNQEMKVCLINGSILYFLGGDNYDTLVGAGIKGCVISEYALQKPNLYDMILEPMLKESKGWCIFNTTPRGENHAKQMYDFLKSRPEYLTCNLTINDTGILTDADLDDERARGKPEEIIQQEYYNSFAGAIYGAYYADMLQKAKIGDYPYDARYPVHTFWDLGVSDSMAIWFVQFVDGTIHLIDCYENSNYGLGHYASVVMGKGYNYAGHHLPHDGTQRQLTLAEKAQSIQGQLLTAGLNMVDVIPRTSDIYADIQAVRAILPICCFNETTTKEGLFALKNYRREYDENRKCFKDTPLHDFSSHYSDSFRAIPQWQRKANQKVNYTAKRWGGNGW